MTRHSEPRLILLLLLFVSTFLLAPARAAVNPADLEALKQLFRGEGHFAKDPATAFEKSWQVFQEPRTQVGAPERDLEGMMEIVRVVGSEVRWYLHV